VADEHRPMTAMERNELRPLAGLRPSSPNASDLIVVGRSSTHSGY
jgi:hypothetical protein